MAKAKRIKQTITERRKVDRVQLILTEGEADFILGLMARIGGNSEASPRKYQPRVRDALTQALGYNYQETDAFQLARGNVHFVEYPADGILKMDGVLDREQWTRVRKYA